MPPRFRAAPPFGTMPLRFVPMLLVPMLLGGCFERTQASVERTPRPVQVVVVALSDDMAARSYSGTIRARREAALGFRTGGRIAARLVDIGAQVREGQVLARLDATDLALGLRSAQADLAAAQAQAAQAVADAARSARLRAEGWDSAAADEAKQAAAQAATEHATTARAALALAQNRLSYAELRAPAGGVITGVTRDSGTVVAEGDPVFAFAEAGPPEIEVQLPEQALPQARLAGARVELWAHPGERFAAVLRELAPAASGRLRTYTARYVVDGAPAWVALGMTATLHLPGEAADLVAILPAAALNDRGNGPSVWQVTAAGALAERRVTLRRLEQDRAVVTGLAAGEQVVAVGAQKLDPKARVRIADIRPPTE